MIQIDPIGLGAPSYLSIDGFKDCLDEETKEGYTSLCLPKEKPVACNEDSWLEILKVFPGDFCSNDDEETEITDEKETEIKGKCRGHSISS